MAQRILVAEDEMMVAFDLCETVEEAGYEIEGPHAGVSSAMLAFQKEKPDLAILDIELNDGQALAFAEMLQEEAIPIIFHSGSLSSKEVEAKFPGTPFLGKPCPPAAMLNAVNNALTAS